MPTYYHHLQELWMCISLYFTLNNCQGSRKIISNGLLGVCENSHLHLRSLRSECTARCRVYSASQTNSAPLQVLPKSGANIHKVLTLITKFAGFMKAFWKPPFVPRFCNKIQGIHHNLNKAPSKPRVYVTKRKSLSQCIAA